MNILISACLLGLSCRYDGQAKASDGIEALQKQHTLIPFCPECMGGLPTPRPPAELVGDRVISKAGTDVTDAYQKGAAEALRLCSLLHCDCAILKERSPSCGHGQIYDGTFSGTLTQGDGITASLLVAHGIPVYGESMVKAGQLPISDKEETKAIHYRKDIK